MQKIRILYYNWIDFEDEGRRGGGVSIYQRNLVEAATRRGDEVWFLSSGLSYSLFARRPFLREVKTRRRGVRKFEIVNSTFLSPGHDAFGKDVADAPHMDQAFATFLREHGPFDVVHFNNLEGIPVSFLRLAREHYPPAKIIYSVHNYFAFCPQVNLWFQERAACRDFHGGRKCVNCLVKQPNPRGTRRLYRLEYCLRRLGIGPQSLVSHLAAWLIFGPLRTAYRLAKAISRGNAIRADLISAGCGGAQQTTKPTAILDPAEAARFAERRQLFVDALNTYTDHVLAVSRRVAELTVGFGIDPAKVQTLYIGTRFARPPLSAIGYRLSAGRHPPADSGQPIADSRQPMTDGGLRLAYLGYMRRDKGFYFYLAALKKMPTGLARRLGLVFAAKLADPRAYECIKRIAHRFASVTFYNGYSHAQLPQILSGVDLAVVPVLWEDNLPQVAIECVGSGVPILTSDRGGAQELLGCPDLVFQAGSRTDFYAKLTAVLDNPTILSAALAGRARLYTPEEHYERLRQGFYCGSAFGTSPTEPAVTLDQTQVAGNGFCAARR